MDVDFVLANWVCPPGCEGENCLCYDKAEAFKKYLKNCGYQITPIPAPTQEEPR